MQYDNWFGTKCVVIQGRDSFAVIHWSGTKKENLLRKIKRAVTKWQQRGADGLECELPITLKYLPTLINLPLLQTCLDYEGVFDLEINIYHNGVQSTQDGWGFDTNLNDTESLKEDW